MKVQIRDYPHNKIKSAYIIKIFAKRIDKSRPRCYYIAV